MLLYDIIYIYNQVYCYLNCSSKLQHDIVLCDHTIYHKTNHTALEPLSIAYIFTLWQGNLYSAHYWFTTGLAVWLSKEEDSCKIYLWLLHVL